MADIRFETVPAEAVSDNGYQEIADLNLRAMQAHYAPSIVNDYHVQQRAGLTGAIAYKQRVLNLSKPHSLYENPRFTLGFDEANELQAVALTADNTSGASLEEQRQKMEARLPLQRWNWLGWVATDPSHQRQGLATRVIAQALKQGSLAQPVSAYAWLDAGRRQPLAHGALERNGLSSVGEPDHDEAVPLLATQRYTSRSVLQSRVAFLRNR